VQNSEPIKWLPFGAASATTVLEVSQRLNRGWRESAITETTSEARDTMIRGVQIPKGRQRWPEVKPTPRGTGTMPTPLSPYMLKGEPNPPLGPRSDGARYTFCVLGNRGEVPKRNADLLREASGQ
jgi:hypothetical protein